MSDFGNVFTFSWKKATGHQEPKYGLIKSNASTLLGHLAVNLTQICQNECYLGLKSSSSDFETGSRSSIINLKSIDLSKLDDLDDSFLTSLWYKTLRAGNDHTGKLSNLDFKLMSLLRARYNHLSKSQSVFRSRLNIHLTKLTKHDRDLLHSFPVSFKLTWPRFIVHNEQGTINFVRTQIFVEQRTKNITLTNPSSDVSVLMQVMLLDDYQPNDDYHYAFPTDWVDDVRRPAKVSSSFSLRFLPSDMGGYKILNADRKCLTVLLEPGRQVSVEVKFRPVEMGPHQTVLIIRNNLTVLDAYAVAGESGTAEIRLENMEPMRTSVFFNSQYQPVNDNLLKTSELSKVIIEMSEADFALCKTGDSAAANKRRGEPANTKWFGFDSITDDAASAASDDEVYLVEDAAINMGENLKFDSVEPADASYVSLKRNNNYSTSYRTRQATYLRSLVELKNIGNTDLIVYHVLFDGEPCVSQGFRAAYCNPFTVSHLADRNVAFLDLRYHPDFRMSLISKRLTLVTNVGDLEYMIEVIIINFICFTKSHSLQNVNKN